MPPTTVSTVYSLQQTVDELWKGVCEVVVFGGRTAECVCVCVCVCVKLCFWANLFSVLQENCRPNRQTDTDAVSYFSNKDFYWLFQQLLE